MDNGLKKKLNLRHLMMISIGGTIGTGLFIGISSPLEVAGSLGMPIAYAIAGIIMLLTMLSLGELSSAIPHSGSFQHYMRLFLKNPYWSFIIGWLYWLSWVLTISADLTATSMTLHHLFHQIPIAVFIGCILLFICGVHLYTVTAYGESETIFASLKIVTIIAFIMICIGLIVFEPTVVTHSGMLTENSRLPHGILGIIASMTTVTYAFQGVEIIGTLAGETDDKGGTMKKVIKMLVIRVFLFYILTTLLLSFVYPAGLHAAISPFVWIFVQVGIPHADVLMEVIIVLCGFSACSSALYASSRLLWSMSKDNVAPSFFGRINRRGSPLVAVIFTAFIASVSLVSAYVAPQHLYIILIATTGQVGCAAWFCIALCHYRFRKEKQCGNFPEYPIKYRAPFFPWLPIIAMTLNGISIMGLWFTTNGIDILLAELALIILLSGCYLLRKNKILEQNVVLIE
ncbi:amino acid permease [Photobacterium kishitanii]|uniref:amino acid permease n=1 Tax=Photobacterium kishitanii TaxID=318456 RepID=UPI000D169F98|nr:amino acid permease [Photobacterium kishitanii]PSU19246.1 amino acid permease [Photobacterium kishitanii]